MEASVFMRRMIVLGSLFSLAMLATKPLFAASSCEANFKAVGDPRNGASYVSFVTIPNMDPHSALGQMEKLTLDAGFSMGSESYEGDVGTLTMMRKDKFSLLHPQNGFPLLVKASKTDNTLWIALKLNQGQTADPGQIQSQLCGMLERVTMDASGAQVAAQQHAESHSDEIINIKAADLAAQVSKKPFHLGINSRNIAGEYQGRVYRIDGQVEIDGWNKGWAAMNKGNSGVSSFELPFDTSTKGLLGARVPGKSNVICRTDPAQFSRFMAVQNMDFITVIGTVVQVIGDNYRSTIYLSCHFEK